MESFCHGACLYWDIRSNGSYYYDYLDLRCYIRWIFFFNLSDVRNYAVFQVVKIETQPPKSAKIPLRNETKVIGSLQPLFTLLLSCSSWSTEYLSLFHRMTSSLRNCNEWTGAKLFLTKHHQYKHEDFLRADSQCLCKRRAMNKSFAIIYILILFFIFYLF